MEIHIITHNINIRNAFKRCSLSVKLTENQKFLYEAKQIFEEIEKLIYQYLNYSFNFYLCSPLKEGFFKLFIKIYANNFTISTKRKSQNNQEE